MQSSFVEDRSVLTRRAPPDEVIRYGEAVEQVADIFYGSHSTRPSIAFMHGGFWRPEYDRLHARPLCRALAAAGWLVASIEYRRIPGNPDATIQDVREALAKLPSMIKSHIELNTTTWVAMGHSAGGHLALLSASMTNVTGVLALAPVTDLRMAEQLNLGNGAVQAFLGSAATERWELDPMRVTPSVPITIVHGLQDEIVPIALAENYARHHNARLVRLDRCGHFAVIDPLSTAWPNIVEELQRLA